MNISNDSMGAARAFDLLCGCVSLVEKICQIMSSKNRMVIDEALDRISKAERIEQKLLSRLQKKYKEYAGIVIYYGKSRYAPMNSANEGQGDPMLDGFELLNEASGLKLKMKFEEFKSTLERLQNIQETNMQLFKDRLKIYDITLNALSDDESSETYGPMDETGTRHRQGKSVLLNQIV